jgi:hypothetical protein
VDIVVKVAYDEFLRLSDTEHPLDEKLEIIRAKLYEDFHTDEGGKFDILREDRLCGYLARRVFINDVTWADFKKTQGVTSDIVKVLQDFLIAGPSYMEAESVE